MDKPLVSIIIPAYNYAHFLAETLNSVLEQSYKKWECIIMDDGSTDNTEEVASKYVENDKRFRYYKQKNQGRSIARNLGLKHSKGEFIQFLDADDLLLPSKIQKQIELFEKDKGFEVCHCDFSFFDSDTGKIMVAKHFTRALKDPLRDFLFEFGSTGFIIPIHCALYKRNVFSDNIKFNSHIEGREDWLLWVDLAIKNIKFIYLNEKLVLYRKHPYSTSHNPRLVEFYRFKTSFIAYDRLPQNIKNEYINFNSEQFVKLIQLERDKLQKFYNSKAYKIIKFLNRFRKFPA